jgi:hypothetical protein
MSHKLDSNFFERLSICIRKSNLMHANSSAIVFVQKYYLEFFNLVVKCIFQMFFLYLAVEIYPKYLHAFYLESV